MKAGLVCLILMFSGSVGCRDKTRLEKSGIQTVRNLDEHPTIVDAKMKIQREKLRGIIVGDGISAEEAQVIAESYFVRNVGCRALSGIRNGEGVWFVEGQFGYAGDPIKDFTINKQTGEVRSPIGPSYKEPMAILAADM